VWKISRCLDASCTFSLFLSFFLLSLVTCIQLPFCIALCRAGLRREERGKKRRKREEEKEEEEKDNQLFAVASADQVIPSCNLRPQYHLKQNACCTCVCSIVFFENETKKASRPKKRKKVHNRRKRKGLKMGIEIVLRKEPRFAKLIFSRIFQGTSSLPRLSGSAKKNQGKYLSQQRVFAVGEVSSLHNKLRSTRRERESVCVRERVRKRKGEGPSFAPSTS